VVTLKRSNQHVNRITKRDNKQHGNGWRLVEKLGVTVDCFYLSNQCFPNCGRGPPVVHGDTLDGPQVVSEEKSLQKLCQTLNE
jgi:hypothetical protein